MDFLPITNRISSIVLSRNIKKSVFYDDVDISASLFSLWRKNSCKPPLDKLEEIADYLEISLEWLLFGGGENENAPADDDGDADRCKLSADEWELIAAYRDLNDEGQSDARKHLFVMQQSGIYKNDRKSKMVSGE